MGSRKQYVSAAQYESVQVRPLEDDSKSTMQLVFEPSQFGQKKSSYIDLGANSFLGDENEVAQARDQGWPGQAARYVNRQNQHVSSKSYLRKAANQQSQAFGLKRPSEDEPC